MSGAGVEVLAVGTTTAEGTAPAAEGAQASFAVLGWSSLGEGCRGWELCSPWAGSVDLPRYCHSAPSPECSPRVIGS